MSEWKPIETSPRDKRILIKSELGEVYAAHWVKHPVTDLEAWLICEWGNGDQALCETPTEWAEIPK